MDQACPNCGFNIHVEDSQMPSYGITVECSRCRKPMNIAPPPKPEPTLKPDRTTMMGSGVTTTAGGNSPQEMMQAFMQMMMGGAKAVEPSKSAFSWARKNLIICCAEANQRQQVERLMSGGVYDVHIAQTAAQAIELMHDIKVDLVVLDPQFDATRQGGIAVLRYVSSLMPKYRRRMYIVLVSPQVKTLDTYMAFLNCVNLTINSDDLDSLLAILEKSTKDFNDLYRPLFEAGGTAPL